MTKVYCCNTKEDNNQVLTLKYLSSLKEAIKWKLDNQQKYGNIHINFWDGSNWQYNVGEK